MVNRLSKSHIRLIDDYFRTHDDGEFCVCPATFKSTRAGDSNHAETIIYTTKHHCLPRITGFENLREPIATISRGGIPTRDDLPFISGSSPSVARFFVGDADPPDILVYSWLGEHLPIIWYGVNDDFLRRHGNLDYKVIRIPMTDSERKSIQMLSQICPDFRELLGECCSSLFDVGLKIELEGAIIHRDEAQA